MNSWNWDEKTLQVFACASHKDASNDFYSRLQVAVDFLFFQSHFLTHFSLSCLLVNNLDFLSLFRIPAGQKMILNDIFP